MKVLKNWWQFIKERFHPLSHIPMILLFTLAHSRIVGFVPVSTLLLTLALTAVFFFKLRLYDEIKDYDVDVIKNPDRPLPRGLLKIDDLKVMIAICIVTEIVLLAFLGKNALFIGLAAIAYSLLMFKEFFIGRILRPHLTTYAVTHTVVTVPLSLTLFCSLTKKPFHELPLACFAFALSNWAIFNVFEFGRKTFVGSEEREGVESYSKVWGRWGAVMLTLIMGLIGTSLYIFFLPLKASYFITLSVIMLISGTIYAIRNLPPWGTLFRAYSSIYIILAYLGILLIYEVNL